MNEPCDMCGVVGGDHKWGCPDLKPATIYAQCCRVWEMPLSGGIGWGRCGLCGKVPKPL